MSSRTPAPRALFALSAVGAMAFLWVVSAGAQDQASLAEIVREDFEKGADRWAPTDPAAWKVIETPKGHAFSQFQASKFKPPHRSPFNFALLKDVQVGDFVLEAKVQSTIKDYNHRDMVVVFGYQNPAHFYYVHFGKQTDDHANNIFIVNEADRKKISTKTSKGTNWTDDWHTVKVARNVASGKIEIYFDDMKTPVMEAEDKNFAWGQVGIGTFDDTGNWDDVVIKGVKVEGKK
jgi:hypothetical protein